MADFDGTRWRRLLEQAVEKKASDIHLSPNASVFFRAHGELEEQGETLTAKDTDALLESWTTPAQRERFRERGELDLARDEHEVRLRVHACSARGGTALSVRLIPKCIPSLEELGAAPIFRRLVALRHGLVLVSGRTGSGKTTTLAAFLDAVAHAGRVHIVTLEDPVEYVHDSGKSLVHQRELGTHFSSFGSAIRSALREDPDILLVGEIRDADAAQAALSAAETGLLVLGSLHTHSAVEAVHRLESFFPMSRQQEIRAQLAMVLEAMVSQMLLPAAEGGRVLASEVLVKTDAVRHLIRSGKPEQLASCILSGAAVGMQAMGQDIERLLTEKMITPETALRFSGERR